VDWNALDPPSLKVDLEAEMAEPRSVRVGEHVGYSRNETDGHVDVEGCESRAFKTELGYEL
jgi:hypothetical protein